MKVINLDNLKRFYAKCKEHFADKDDTTRAINEVGEDVAEALHLINGEQSAFHVGNVVQETGDSTTNVMSQDAVTKALASAGGGKWWEDHDTLVEYGKLHEGSAFVARYSEDVDIVINTNYKYRTNNNIAIVHMGIETMNVIGTNLAIEKLVWIYAMPQLQSFEVLMGYMPLLEHLPVLVQALSERAMYTLFRPTNVPMLEDIGGLRVFKNSPLGDAYGHTKIGFIDLTGYTNEINGWGFMNKLVDFGGFVGLRTSINLSYATLLTAQSVANIINSLDDVTELTTSPTITFASKQKGYISTELQTTLTNKGWTLA